MSVSSCLRTMQWSTPLYQLPRSSLQGVSALPVPHFILGKRSSVLTTRLPCRWLESILEVSGRLLSNRYLIKCGSIRIRLRVWPLGVRASPSHEPFLRALEPWLGGPSAWCGGSWLGCAVVQVTRVLFQSRGKLPIVEAPGYSRHPTSILAMQLLNAFKCNLKELTTKSAFSA